MEAYQTLYDNNFNKHLYIWYYTCYNFNIRRGNMKINVKNILLIISLITIIICYYFGNDFKILFIIELLYLILLALEKIISPLHSINKTEINKSKYYRDELSNYSPFINAILLNRNIFDADVIVAMFLYLEDKGYYGSTTYQNDNLLPHELDFIQKQDFYLSYFKAKDYTNKDLIKFKKLIINDMITENILIKNKRNLFVDKIDLISLLFVMVHLILFAKLEPNLLENNYIIMEFIYNIMWFTIYISSHILNLSIIQILTPKGKKYYGELLASRKFLKDFSIISNRNIEEKYLWNSYLYNAILFNLQGKLDKEAYRYYKSLLSKNNYYTNKNYDFLWTALTTAITLLPWILLYFKGNWEFKFFLQDFINAYLIMSFISKSASYRFFSQ